MSVAAGAAITNIAKFMAPEVLVKFNASMGMFKNLFAYDVMTDAIDKVLNVISFNKIMAGPAGMITAKITSQTMEARIKLAMSLVQAVQQPAIQNSIALIALFINAFQLAASKFTTLFNTFQNSRLVLSPAKINTASQNFNDNAKKVEEIDYQNWNNKYIEILRKIIEIAEAKNKK